MFKHYAKHQHRGKSTLRFLDGGFKFQADFKEVRVLQLLSTKRKETQQKQDSKKLTYCNKQIHWNWN